MVASAFLTDKNPNHRHGGLLSWAHPSGSRPLEDICTSSVAPGSFWHAAEEQASPTRTGPIEVQIDQRDSEEGQPAGQRSCQMLLSDPVMDTHVGAGSWPTVSEVLQQLMGHDEAGALVSFFCPWGCWRVYQNVRGSWLQHTSGVNCLRYTTALPCLSTHPREKIFKWRTRKGKGRKKNRKIKKSR